MTLVPVSHAHNYGGWRSYIVHIIVVPAISTHPSLSDGWGIDQPLKGLWSLPLEIYAYMENPQIHFHSSIYHVHIKPLTIWFIYKVCF